jgi:predicted RecB family nuclease
MTIISLVAGMGRAHRDALEAAGIVTLASLGALGLPLAARVPRLPAQSLERLHQQARLQLEARTAPPRYDLLPVEAGRGLSRLPVPSPGDIFFDIEADRYAVDGTLHYLLGWVVAGNGASSYRGLRAMSRLEEKMNFESFIDEVLARRARHPDLHVYHFAAFERTALALMAARSRRAKKG